MTADTARRLMCKDINSMTLEKLQRHKIRLLDAWRESTGEYYGFEQAVRDGFMAEILSESAQGYTPKDMWLTHRLNFAYEQCCLKEKELLKEIRRQKKNVK
jgi:hypothetical protein